MKVTVTINGVEYKNCRSSFDISNRPERVWVDGAWSFESLLKRYLKNGKERTMSNTEPAERMFTREQVEAILCEVLEREDCSFDYKDYAKQAVDRYLESKP